MTTVGLAVAWYDFPGLVACEVATGIRADVALACFDDVSVPWNSSKAAPFVVHGAAPQLTWTAKAPLADIAAGKWDAQITQAARWSSGSGLQVRPFHEMNAPGSAYYGDPATYVAAWKRARKVWRAAGNAAPWIWSPNITDSGLHPFAAYYPGDDQCEMVGLDGYSYPKGLSKSFADIFDADLAALGKLSTRPLAICETGVDKMVPNRAAWISAMWIYVLTNPRISHVTYWNRDTYRIDNDPAAASAFHLGVSAFRR